MITERFATFFLQVAKLVIAKDLEMKYTLLSKYSRLLLTQYYNPSDVNWVSLWYL